MNQPSSFSDELLNAFVDDELSGEDKARIYQAMQTDPVLRDRIAALRSVSDLVKTAYSSVGTDNVPQKQAWGAAPWALAASVILGFTLGWFGYAGFHPQNTGHNTGQHIASNSTQVQAQQRVVFHITHADATAFEHALDEAERLLTGRAPKLGPVQHVKVIANGAGLVLLTEGAEPQIRSRVAHMAAKYANLTFVGCLQTRKLMVKNGAQTKRMLSGVAMVESGTSEALLLQKQGWSYISI